MSALLIIVVTFFGYILAYRTYGSYLAEKIFNLNPKNITPAKQFSDGKDFVESAKHLMFGHHFTSIAGTSGFLY